MTTHTEATEREKYQRVWTHKRYRRYSPAMPATVSFFASAHPRGSVLDLGAGVGRASLDMLLAGYRPMTMIDIADNCLDPGIAASVGVHPDFRFERGCLWSDPLPDAEYGFCVDVMEHIPPAEVRAVLINVRCAVRRCFFRIATGPDSLGEQLIGEPLHLCVEPAEWWRGAMVATGWTVLWSEIVAGAVLFWVGGRDGR